MRHRCGNMLWNWKSDNKLLLCNAKEIGSAFGGVPAKKYQVSESFFFNDNLKLLDVKDVSRHAREVRESEENSQETQC